MRAVVLRVRVKGRWVHDVADVKRRKSVVTFVREGEDEGGEDNAASTTSNTNATPGTVTGLAGAGKGTAAGGTWSKANGSQTNGWGGKGQRRVERCWWRIKVCFCHHLIHVTSSKSPRCSRRVLRSSNLTFLLSPGRAFAKTEVGGLI